MRTLNMNNKLYKFIPRRKANWLALLTPQGYAKCLSSTTVLRLMSYETSKVRLKLHLFRLSYPGPPSLINYRWGGGATLWSLW